MEIASQREYISGYIMRFQIRPYRRKYGRCDGVPARFNSNKHIANIDRFHDVNHCTIVRERQLPRIFFRNRETWRNENEKKKEKRRRKCINKSTTRAQATNTKRQVNYQLQMKISLARATWLKRLHNNSLGIPGRSRKSVLRASWI